MTKPEWKSDDPNEQQALARYVIRELDLLDEQASAEANNNQDAIQRMQAYVDLLPQAKAANMKLSPPFATPKPGRGRPARRLSADDVTDFERAAFDVPRIRAIFVRDYEQRNRTKHPLAEEIAAQRWELSAEETASLIDKFQRKS